MRRLSLTFSRPKSSNPAGATSAQVESLWGAGSVYYKLGNLEAATSCYQEALKDALTIQSLEEIVGLHTDLAFVLYQERQFAAARTHSEEAIQAARISGDNARELDSLFLQALLAERRQMVRTQNGC